MSKQHHELRKNDRNFKVYDQVTLVEIVQGVPTGRQSPNEEIKTMTDETANTEQIPVAADCPNERFVINPDELIGDWIDKKCPKCGAQMLGNKVGDEWCSSAECDYGCKDFYKELGL